MVDDDDKKVFTSIAEEHTWREAERLKKAWFDHVLVSLEKLNANVNKLSSTLHEAKDSLFKDIVSTKEILRKEIAGNKADISFNVDKLEKRIEKSIDKVNKSIEDIAVQSIKDELKHDLADLQSKHTVDLKELRDENLPIRDSITGMKVKISLIAFISGLVGAAVLTGIVEFFVHVTRHAVIK